MSKEYLEAWNFIKDQMQNFTFSHLVAEMVKNADIVEQALLELQSIKESNPSEALEKLDKINNYLNDVYDYKEIEAERRKDIDFIKQALLRLDRLDDVMNLLPNRFSCINNREIIVMRTEMYEQYQEQEKVLEILKPLCEVVETPVKKYRYLKMNGVVVYTFKNEEEFELLKRYFK